MHTHAHWPLASDEMLAWNAITRCFMNGQPALPAMVDRVVSLARAAGVNDAAEDSDEAEYVEGLTDSRRCLKRLTDALPEEVRPDRIAQAEDISTRCFTAYDEACEPSLAAVAP